MGYTMDEGGTERKVRLSDQELLEFANLVMSDPADSWRVMQKAKELVPDLVAGYLARDVFHSVRRILELLMIVLNVVFLGLLHSTEVAATVVTVFLAFFTGYFLAEILNGSN